MTTDDLVSWEYITGTTDVASELHITMTPDGVQELLFNIKNDHTLRLPLNDFLLCWRLFNMVFYSRLLGEIDICVNTECDKIPYGCHQRTDECPGKSPWQRKQEEKYAADMRELRRQEALRIASVGGEDSN